MPKAASETLIFTIERETKTKVRFQETTEVSADNRNPQPVPKEDAVCEKMYFSKKWLKKHGNPDLIRVTLDIP